MTTKPGVMVDVGTAYDAAIFIFDEWPPGRGGPKLASCKEILLKCLEGECSSAIARVAFIEAAREARIYLDTPARPASTGKCSSGAESAIQQGGRSVTSSGCLM